MQGRYNKDKSFKRAFFRVYKASSGKEVYSIVMQIPRVKKNCISLEGGGSACVAYAGFLKAYDEYGALDDVDTVAGVSGGAVAALAVALGYTGEEIASRLESMPMKDFIDYRDKYSWQTVEALNKIWHIKSSKHRALSDGKKYLEFIRSMITEKLGDPDAGFEDLLRVRKNEIKEKGYSRIKPNLLLNVTDFTGRIGKLVTVSRKNPILNLANATYASGSFPGLLPDLIVDENGVAEPEDTTKHIDNKKYKRYGDGGFKENLCRAALNDQDYYPPDVPHGVINSEGKREHVAKNPGVVYVKIDTSEEMAYIRDNVNPPRENVGFFNYWMNLGNDALDIQDVDAIRKEDVLFLPDNDVSRYKLDLPDDAKMGLVKSAEDATREYLQNRYQTAGHLAVFRGDTEAEAIRQWLDPMSYPELRELIHIYEDMRDELNENAAERIKREQLSAFDRDQPTVKQLQEMINALEEYAKVKFHGKKDRRSSNVDKCPLRFINISEKYKQLNWEVKVEQEMCDELENIEEKIVVNEKDCAVAYKALSDCMYRYEQGKTFSEKLISDKEKDESEVEEREEHEEQLHMERFHGYFDEQILSLVAYQEYLAQLYERRDDLKNKLGVALKPLQKPDLNSSQEYQRLHQRLYDLQHEWMNLPSLNAILLESLPVLVIKNPIREYKMDIRFDMRHQLDRRIYLVGALLFLQQVKSLELHHFEAVFEEFFQEKMPKPVTIDQLGTMLDVSGPELQVALMRMEKLLHYFEKKHFPHKEPELSIDVVIGVSRYSHMRKVLRRQKAAEQQDEEIPMTVFFKDKQADAGIVNLSGSKNTIWHPLLPGGSSDGEDDVKEASSEYRL